MAYSPEFDQKKSSLTEAGRHLLGALARTHLKIAILEAENAKKPIEPKKMAWLKERFADADYHAYVKIAYWVYSSAWKREKGDIWGYFLHSLNRWRARRKRKIGRKKELINQKIIDPLCEIYTEIEGEEPDPSQPWLGKLFIDTALEKEGTEKVASFLSQFGIDPETLVWEVYQYLDRDLEK